MCELSSDMDDFWKEQRIDKDQVQLKEKLALFTTWQHEREFYIKQLLNKSDKIKDLEIQLAELKAIYEANLLDAAKAKRLHSIGTSTTLLDSNAPVPTSTTTNTTRAMSMPASTGNAQMAMVTTSAGCTPVHTLVTSLNAQFGLKIPKYKSPGDIEIFVNRFDEYCLHQNINNNLKANLMLQALDDKTFNIIMRELNENERQNYYTVKTFLLKRLNAHQTTGHKRLLFRQMKCESNQSLEEFYTNLLGLAAKAFCDETPATIDRMIIDQFIAGCEIDNIRLHLIQNNPKTSREAIDMAVNHQAALRYNDLLNNSATMMSTEEKQQSKIILRPTTQIEQYKRNCYGKRGRYNFRRSHGAECNNWRKRESKENCSINAITTSSNSILQRKNDKEVFNKLTRRPTGKCFLQNRKESYCYSSIPTKYSYSVNGASERRPSTLHIVKKITPIPKVTDQQNRSSTSTTRNAKIEINSDKNAVNKPSSSILLPSSQTSSGASISKGMSNYVKESESTLIKNNEQNEGISKYLMRLLMIIYSLLLMVNSFITKMTNFEGSVGHQKQSYDLSIGWYT